MVPTNLGAPWVFARMHTLPLLGLADSILGACWGRQKGIASAVPIIGVQAVKAVDERS